MNSNVSLVDELALLLQHPGDPALLREALIVGAALMLAWGIAALLTRWLAPYLREAAQNALADSAQIEPLGGWRGILLPLVAFVLMSLGRAAFAGPLASTPLITLASTLALAYGLVRLLVYALRRAFAPNALLRASERLIATSIWIGVVLYLLGLLPRLRSQLDAMNFSVGKQSFSLLLLLQLVAAVALTLIVALWLSRFLESRIMAQSGVDLSLRAALAKILRTVLLFLAVLIALPLVGIDITALSVFGGALGVGVGFGLQKVASNYVSGFIILLERSIRLGDLITVDERQGVVAKINARYSVVRGMDGTESIIPNETFITQTVVNHSASDRRLLVKMPLQVSYQSNIETALTIMEQAGSAPQRVMRDPAPLAVLKGFGESGIDLELYVWVGDPENGYGPLKSDILREVWRKFQEHNITIPYPQREVRVLERAPANPT